MTRPKDMPTHRVPILPDRGSPSFANVPSAHSPDDTLLGVPRDEVVVKDLTGIAASKIAKTMHGMPAITTRPIDGDTLDPNNQTSLGIGPNPSAAKKITPLHELTAPATDDLWFDVALGDLSPQAESTGSLRSDHQPSASTFTAPRLDADTADLLHSSAQTPVPMQTPRTLEIKITGLNNEIERLEKEVDRLTRLLNLAKEEKERLVNSIVETNQLVVAHKKMVEKYNALYRVNQLLDARIIELTAENQRMAEEKLATETSVVSSKPGLRIQQFTIWVRNILSKFK